MTMPTKLCSDIIGKQDIDLLIEWLKDVPRLTKGEKTLEFEDGFSKKINSKHSIYCNSGSSANLLIVSALQQMGLLHNNKIVVPQVSWSTTVFPVIQFGLTPVLCDCNLDNLGIDIVHLEQIIRDEKPAAIILVHVLGFDSHIEKIIELCKANNVIVIEDTCESLGSRTSGKMLGTFGLASSFSFYFGHHISTIEGGMVCTDDDDFADMVRMIRSHGWDRDLSDEKKQQYRSACEATDFDSLYKFYYAGFNLRSTDLQAFLGINQLSKIDFITEQREANYWTYRNNLRDDLWKPTLEKNQDTVSNMGYPIIVKNKNEIYNALSKEQIECRPLVAGSMGMQPAWVNLYGEAAMPNATVIDKQGMYLPNHQDLTEENIINICSIINKEAQQCRK
jgi:CDP-6-deoxy-D-xylo-4-hexulose-3-dehydrase